MYKRRHAALFMFLALFVSGIADARQARSDAEERALSSIVERWTAARNANDAEAMRPLFAEAVDRVSLPDGMVQSTTRDELLKFFADGFKGSAKGTYAKTMKVRPILFSDATGIVDHTYTMYNPDGSEIGVGHSTFVALKVGAEWKVVAVRFVSAWGTRR